MNKSYLPTRVHWEYVNLRNISLLQISFWAAGLNNPGFYPPMRFHFGNYIGVGVPGQGNHGIFDQIKMDTILREMQTDIDKTTDFAKKLHKRALYIYSRVKKSSQALNRPLLNLDETRLRQLYKAFRDDLIFSPIILMPMYAVDGCLMEDYLLSQFLYKRLRPEQVGQAISVLSTTTYKTVAYSERESFLLIALFAQKNKIKALDKNPQVIRLIKNHIKNFNWVNSEYLSQPWDEKKYLQELKKLIANNPPQEYHELKARRAKSLAERKKLINKLDPPMKVQKVIDALNEFNWQVDYSKGVFSAAFLSFRNMLNEIARRNNLPVNDLYFYYIDEFNLLSEKGRKADDRVIQERKKGYLMLLHKGKFRVFAGQEMKKVAKKEKVDKFFAPVKFKSKTLKGIIGSKGMAIGRAKIVTSIKDMAKIKKGDILITYMTTMEFTPLFHLAGAVVTDEGGLGCHAAIVSREFGIPCIVGTKIATKIFKDGDHLEIDANKGIIKILK